MAYSNAQNNTGDTLALITGGCNVTDNISVKSVEVYPRTENCTVPDLPLRRRRHTTFLTSDSSPSIAICGGVEQGVWTSASCLVLDQANQVWNDTIMGSLTMARENGAAVTLNHVGVFIIGGEGTSKTTSQGGRSCAGARVAPAEKLGLGRKF